MDAVEYLKQKRRITKKCKTLICDDCPLGYKNNRLGVGCIVFELEHPEEAVKAIENWVEENPVQKEL